MHAGIVWAERKRPIGFAHRVVVMTVPKMRVRHYDVSEGVGVERQRADGASAKFF